MPGPGIFQASDYKELLRERLKQAGSPWGQIRSLAEAAGCQRSYLSQVLHAHPHLTKDQAYGVAKHWRLTPAETEYFLSLVELARCGSPSYRRHLEARLRELRQENENLSRKVSPSKPAPSEVESLYYSAWYWAAIHLLTSVPRFQSVPAIAERLQLPQELVEGCLTKLAEWGMVTRARERWSFAGGNLHLPAASPLTTALHQNWRSRALLDVQLGREDSIHYSSLHALSRKAYAEVRALIQRLVEETHAAAGPSTSEELACVTIDAFRV